MIQKAISRLCLRRIENYRYASSQQAQQQREILEQCSKRKSIIQDMCALDPECPQPKVVIVGAGLAGLSAAHRLIVCGLKNVVILEGQDRPGGRIYTKKFGDVSIDLGASWINGACTGNPAFNLACQEGAIQKPIVRTKRLWDNCCFDSSGRFIRSAVFISAAQLFDDIIYKAKDKYKKDLSDMSLWDYLEKKIEAALTLFPSPDRKAAAQVFYSLTNEVCNEVGTSLKCIPIGKFGRIKKYPGGNVAVKSGMARILNPLLKVITPDRIKYNKVAVKVQWKLDGPRCVVVTSDGKRENADYLILAVPLGVLKAGCDKMFDPPLPPYKRDAIQALGVGYVSNIALKYRKPFWMPGEGYIRICWSKEEITSSNHWTKGVHLIEENPITHDILHLTVAGPPAVETECLTDCQLASDITGLMRKFLENGTIPMPEGIFRTKWYNNSFIRGGRTFLGVQGSEGDFIKLAEPIGAELTPTVLFAGEACAAHEGGMPAARLSGIMEAERILKYTRCFCGPPPPPYKAYCL